jgi:O-antigen ligase
MDKDLIFNISLLLLVYTPLFFPLYAGYPLALCFFIWLFNVKKENFFLLKNRFSLPFYTFICFFLINLGSYLFIDSELKYITRLISFALIPVVIFASNLSIEKIELFLLNFVRVQLIIIIIALISVFIFIVNHYQSVNKLRYVQWIFPHLINIHPTYWTIYLNLGIIFAYIFQYKQHKKKTIFFVVLIILFNTIIFILSSRTGLIVCIIVNVFYLIKNNMSFRKLKFPLFFFLLLIFFSPMFKNKLQNLKNDDRFKLWEIGLSVIKENNYIYGKGIGNSYKILKEKNKNKNRTSYFGFDIHNEYLKNWIELGILGLIAIIFIFIYPLFEKEIKKELILIHLVIAFFCLTEPVLSRINGIILFVFFSSVFYMYFSKQTIGK